jgi:hypothetical protein
MRGSPSQQAKDNMFRVKDVLKNCPVFRYNDLSLEHLVVFSNPRTSITIGQEPEYGCKVVHFKKKADSNPADFIANKPIRFSDQVAKIEQCLRANIANYRIRQFAFKESCALHMLSKSLPNNKLPGFPSLTRKQQVQHSGWINNFSELRFQAFSETLCSLRLDDHTHTNPDENAGSS